MQHFMGGTSDTWLTVVNDRFGIPRFAQRGERLSIAHHEGIGLAAVSSGASVGIDIEALHHFESLPLRILGYEDSALARLANTQGATPAQLKCALWVTMEALGKSLGTGLTAGADALRVVDVEHYHWGWRMGFQRYPQASAYVWPVPERLVGLVVHARALTASAQVGQHLRRLICAAQRSACPVDAIAIRRMKTRAPLAFENPAESGCLG